MSDTSNIPFEGGSTALATPPAPAAADFDGAPAGGNRGKLLALGGVAAVVLLAMASYFLFFSGGSDTAAPAAQKPIRPSVAPSTAASAPAVAKQPRLSAKRFGRDPFKALIVEAPAPAASAGSTDTSATGTGTTSTGTTGDSATTTTTTPTQTTSHSFRVVNVAPDNSSVTVKVDGKLYTNLRAGEVFATYFKVILISGTTNAFQYGEEKFNVLGTKRITIA